MPSSLPMSVPPSTSALPARDEILATVRTLLAELLNLETEDPILETSLLAEDLQVDSLGMVDMVTLVEEAYSLRLPSNTDLTAIKTPGHIVDLVVALLEKKAAA